MNENSARKVSSEQTVQPSPLFTLGGIKIDNSQYAGHDYKESN